MITRCLLAVLLMGTAVAKDFIGMRRLTRFSRDANAKLLVYFNNENNFVLLNHGRPVPLAVDTHLWDPEACCAHRATPSLSRDGGRIAFVHLKSIHPRQEAISVLDIAAGREKDVFLAAMVWGISWSPEGDRLAVVADKGDGKGHKAYVIDMASSAPLCSSPNAVELAGGKYLISDYVPPSWSPDGLKLALELRRSGPGANNSAAGIIAIWDLPTQTMHKLADGVEPSWSPGGDAIAFFDSSRRNCSLIKPDGTERKLLFSATKGLLGVGGRAPLFFPVAWSPDGRRLVFHEWVQADLIAEVYQLDLAARKTKHLGRSELQVVNWR